MWRWLGYAALAIIAYGVFVVWRMPASTLLSIAQQQLPKVYITAAAIEGSLWQGSAEQVQIGQRKIAQLSWAWQPSGLLQACLQYQLTISEPETYVDAQAGIGFAGQLRLFDVNGQLPLPRAIALAGRPPPPLGGQLQVALSELRLNRQGKPAAVFGQLHLRRLHTTFGRTLELGDFIAELGSKQNTMLGQVRDTEQGPLQLAAEIQLNQDGRYQVAAELSLREQSNAELNKAFSLLGRPLPDGKWHFDFSGRLTL